MIERDGPDKRDRSHPIDGGSSSNWRLESDSLELAARGQEMIV
jgi:hypothetical protein